MDIASIVGVFLGIGLIFFGITIALSREATIISPLANIPGRINKSELFILITVLNERVSASIAGEICVIVPDKVSSGIV